MKDRNKFRNKERDSQNMTDSDMMFMREALSLARRCLDDREAPVGCVIAADGRIVGTGRNRRETDKNALAHAEIEAINAACAAMGGWRLDMCDLYVTLEPCPMCAGAIVNARVRRVFYGAADPKAGALGGLFDLLAYPVNHKPEVTGGLLAAESAALLSGFFRELREEKKGNNPG